MAPEYFKAGHFSAKSDVYGFGVIFLELLSGKLRYSVDTLEEEDDLLSNVSPNLYSLKLYLPINIPRNTGIEDLMCCF